MRESICGIILKTSYPNMGDTSKIEVLGKTMLDWVRLALADDFCAAAANDEEKPLPLLLAPYIKKSEFTVVLYSDTPLITRKTVLDAVYDLKDSRENVLKMSRGYVFRTAYLQSVEKIFAANHRFFDEEDFLTAFSFKQVALIADALRDRIINYHMGRGVQFDDPNSTFVGCDVIIEKNVVIGAGNTLKGRTIIKESARLKGYNTLEDAIIDENAQIQNSTVSDSYVGKNSTVGPYAHLRNKTKVGHDCRIGNFVEIKNSVIGAKTKIAHLSYVGDAEVGEGCNIGCGTVFCNYDGKSKHKTILGSGVFVGSNANLVAPLKIGENAVIAAGSTITADVPAQSLAIARSRQTNKQDYMKNKEKNQGE